VQNLIELFKVYKKYSRKSARGICFKLNKTRCAEWILLNVIIHVSDYLDGIRWIN